MLSFLCLLLVLCHVTYPTGTEAASIQNGVGEVKTDASSKEAAQNAGVKTTPTIDIHGGVKMGEIRHDCDDLKWNLDLDWDNSTDYEYTCQTGKGEERIPVGPANTQNMVVCMDREDIPFPIHVCMDQEIVYTDEPPTAGPHRPNWPSFGTYTFCPAQRWIHTLEHGGVVLLYHPCADTEQVAILTTIVRSCIRKHVITPYRYLPPDQPLALVTYGCKLLMSRVNHFEAVHFIKTTAMETVESVVTKDGLYTMGQIEKADIVSDIEDSELCPNPPIYGRNLPIAESMDQPYTVGKEQKDKPVNKNETDNNKV